MARGSYSIVQTKGGAGGGRGEGREGVFETVRGHGDIVDIVEAGFDQVAREIGLRGSTETGDVGQAAFRGGVEGEGEHVVSGLENSREDRVAAIIEVALSGFSELRFTTVSRIGPIMV
jgi:hypothetical protein